MMKKIKELYCSPNTTVLVVRFEDTLLTVSTDGNTIRSASIDEWSDEL